MFVCHGNICRSPMAQSVLTHLVRQAGLADSFIIESAATSREEIGHDVHYGTKAKLREKGIALVAHRAVQLTQKDYFDYDYLIGMDQYNLREMQRIAGGDPEKKLYRMLDFCGEAHDVADPWYTGDFEATYRDVRSGCEALLAILKEQEAI